MAAKLPSAVDLQRRPAQSATPAISVQQIDYGPAAKAAGAAGDALKSVGAAVGAFAAADEKTQEYDVNRRMLDFKLDSEMAFEQHRREGGDAASWQSKYQDMAAQFVGPKDANIPMRMRGLVGNRLKQHEVLLSERAQRDDLAEQDAQGRADLESTMGKVADAAYRDPGRLESVREEARALIDQSPLPPRIKAEYHRKVAQHVEGAAANGLADTVTDLDSYNRAKSLLAPSRPDKVTAKGVATGIRGLGDVSARYESGGKGVALISSGQDDPGGVSYGKHQLSTKDSMPAFLRSPEGSTYAKRFDGLNPGTSAFNKVYRDIVSEDPKAFEDAQHAFYARTHYEPARAHAEALGFDVGDRGVQEALFSIGVQHGGAKKIISQAAGAGADPAAQIKALFAARASYVEQLGSLPGNTKASVLNRYRSEVRDALSLAGSRADAGAGAVPPGQSVDSYDGPFSNLGFEKRRALMGRVDARFETIKKGIAHELDGQIKVALDGNLPPDAKMAELQRQVQRAGDPQLAAKFDEMVSTAQFVQSRRQTPGSVVAQEVQQWEAYAQQHGETPELKKQIEQGRKLSETLTKQQKEDAIGWASRAQITTPDRRSGDPDAIDQAPPPRPVEIKPIVWGAQGGGVAPDLDRQLDERFDAAKRTAAYLGQPEQILSKNERPFVVNALKTGGQPMLDVLGKLVGAAHRANVDPVMVMRELTHRDAPEVAVVGDMVLAGVHPDTLSTAATALSWKIRQGESFKPTIDKAQVKPTLGEYAEVLKNRPEMVDAYKATIDLVYEYTARQKSLDAFDAGTYEQVLHRAFGKSTVDGIEYGGIGKQKTFWGTGFGGSHVLVPPEIKSSGFDDMVGALQAKDLAANPPVDARGQPLSTAAIRAAAWESVGPGRYIMVLKTDPEGRKIWAGAPGASGALYVLDINPLLPAIQKRAPQIFRGWDGRTQASPDQAPIADVPPARLPAAQTSPATSVDYGYARNAGDATRRSLGAP